MPCGMVHPNQRVIGDDVPGTRPAISGRGGPRRARLASPQTQLWSMPHRGHAGASSPKKTGQDLTFPVLVVFLVVVFPNMFFVAIGRMRWD